MSSSRFWYVPLKQLLPEDTPFASVLEAEVIDESMLAEWAPQKLQSRGVAQGDLLALMEGTETRGVARVIRVAPHTVKWLTLPVSQGPELTSAPNLAEVPANEAAEFKFAVDTLLRDVVVAVSIAGAAQPKEYAPVGPASNLILYGPPGTGKTHSIRRRSLELLGDENAATRPIGEAQREWDRLRRDGQIVFCTFHQAFAYEEFVEGLRAITDEKGNIHYKVEPGIFKQLALTAAAEGLVETVGVVDLDFDTRWSLLIAELDAEARIVKSKSGKDYVLETSARDNIRAHAGSHNGEGVFIKNADATPLIASRKTMDSVWAAREALGDDPTTTQLEPYSTGGSQVWMVYQELRKTTVDSQKDSVEPMEKARRALVAGLPFDFRQTICHYVLVIDEINRANIARVFGELITLLEPDKRLGCQNELRVQLPSSKEWFGVPPNLHVLGTMNTADRSIALMDVALRRRFTFEEMMPDVVALTDALTEAGVEADLRTLVVNIFAKLNERLRYLYDRDHQVGHAYFVGVRSISDLRAVFALRILPLLQEYFFGQWDKIALALGYPLNAEGSPKELRDENHPLGTFLIAQKLDDRTVLGFERGEYRDQIAWDVHPHFRPRGQTGDAWLAQAFNELVGKAGA